LNREIKFRLFDKKENKVVYSRDVIMNIHGDIFEYNYEKQNYIESYNYEVMQYVGVKDKNGKPIFEGDVVKINGYGVEDLITDIYWEDSLGGFYSRNLYESDTFEHSGQCIEIIGNIYENKELINE